MGNCCAQEYYMIIDKDYSSKLTTNSSIYKNAEVRNKIYDIQTLKAQFHKHAYKMPHGSIYNGNLINHQPQGFGLLHFQDGSYYLGNFYKGQQHGKGVYFTKQGNSFQGVWKNNQFKEGKAKMGLLVFEGQFKKLKIHGAGQQKWPDGTSYKGRFEQGLKQGRGIMRWSNGDIYNGQFEKDQINGYGQFIWKDKRNYIGYWKNNKVPQYYQMQGNGVYKATDKQYNGEYKQSKKHGYGLYTQNGKKYKGIWENGLLNGKAIITNTKAQEFEVQYQKGRLISKKPIGFKETTPALETK